MNCNIYIDHCIFDFTNYPYEGVINFGQDLYLNEHDSDKPFITFINNMIITAKTYANSLTPSCIFYKASKVMNPNISALDIFYCDNNTIRYKKFFDMDLFSNISKAGGVKIWT